MSSYYRAILLLIIMLLWMQYCLAFALAITIGKSTEPFMDL